MGSVGENYRCPLCGVTGMGGYSLDGINYPICTDGNFSCLEKVLEHGATPTSILAQGLNAAIGDLNPELISPVVIAVFTPEFITAVASFLAEDSLICQSCMSE